MKRAIVIGGGVVGCHTAICFAQGGYEAYLFERHPRLGMESSSRNSGVLHAGIYYEGNSLKALLCIEGNRLSREFFASLGVGFLPTGKYLIARTPEEEDSLEWLRARAGENGVPVTMLARKSIRDEIPMIRCAAALHSPDTGIIDTGDYFKALRALLYRHDVELLCSNMVMSIGEDGLVRSKRGDLKADIIINCAGLDSDLFAGQCGLNEYRIRPLKGDYYASSDLPLKIPVYPPPNTQHHTLGMHLTPTFGKEVLIGPSEIPSPAKDDYTILTPRKVFEDALESMLVDDYRGSLHMHEGFSGNRPRVYCKDVRCDDFIIVRRPENVIHLLGIESPGLTAAPALARYVYEMS